MPRNGSGVYALPAGLPVNGEVSNATDDVRTPFSDIEADLNAARPIVAGGTGATTAADARTNLGITPANIGAQPLDATLTALAAYNTNGLLTQTAADTFTGRTLTAGTGITVTNGNGVAGNPTVAVSGNLSSLAGVSLAAGDVLYATGASTLVRLGIGTAGQVLRVNTGATAPEWGSGGLTFATPQATTSGTQFDFGSIPAGVSEVEVVFRGVSLSGTDNILVQLGTSGGFVATGYDSGSNLFVGGSSVASNSTAGFIVTVAAASRSAKCVMRIVRSEANTWNATLSGGQSASNNSYSGGGDIALAAALTQVRITRTGTDTFDAGSVTVGWR